MVSCLHRSDYKCMLLFCQWLETEFLRYLGVGECGTEQRRCDSRSKKVDAAQCRDLNMAQSYWYADTHYTYMLTHNYVCIHTYYMYVQSLL